MKKSIYLLLISAVIALSTFASLASAQTDVTAETKLGEWGKTAAGGIAEALNAAKLNPTALSTVLLGILLWIIIYTITIKLFGFGKERWGVLAGGAVSLIIVLLSFIYLPEGFIEAIVLQYGAMGATILTLIPFLLLLYFSISVSRSLFVARVIWAFYIVYYFALFIYKVGLLSSGTTVGWFDYVPYVAAIIGGIIVFFMLPTIRNLVFKGELSSREEKAMKDINIRKLGRELEQRDAEGRFR